MASRYTGIVIKKQLANGQQPMIFDRDCLEEADASKLFIHSIFLRNFDCRGKFAKGAQNDEGFAGSLGRHYLLMWGTHVSSFMTVKLCRQGSKQPRDFVGFDINYTGKQWAYMGIIPCGYIIKKSL